MTTKKILELESGIYTATMEGEEITIRREKGFGFEIVHSPNSKGWCEVTMYDEDGNLEGQTVERH